MEDNIHYLVELRKRLLRSLCVTALVFAALSFYASQVYRVFTVPILKYLSGNNALIAISVPAPFLVPFKSALVAAIYLTVPYGLYQIWMFIAPALYKKEKKMVWPLLISSSLLFYIGSLFAYFIVLPWVFKFFINVAPSNIEVKPDISKYFTFVVRTFFAFGLSFELPIAIMLLVWSGITTVANLSDKRPYMIISAFVLGMLLTPPDVLSQIMLAIPLWMLYELGLVMARIIVRDAKKVEV